MFVLLKMDISWYISLRLGSLFAEKGPRHAERYHISIYPPFSKIDNITFEAAKVYTSLSTTVHPSELKTTLIRHAKFSSLSNNSRPGKGSLPRVSQSFSHFQIIDFSNHSNSGALLDTSKPMMSPKRPRIELKISITRTLTNLTTKGVSPLIPHTYT